jgi:hypothetical protein
MPLPVRTKPHQQSGSPQLLVWDVATELIGEVEPKFAEREIEINRDRCLDETRPDSRLLSHSTHVGQPAGKLASLSEQQLERLYGNVVPRHAAATVGL